MWSSLRRASVLAAAPAATLFQCKRQASSCDQAVTTTTTTTTTTSSGQAAPDPNYPPHGLAPGIQKMPKWIQAGCGDLPYYCSEKGCTFGYDGVCPPTMPDFSKHHGVYLKDHLTPEMYARLKDKKTSMGVTLAHCIKTGVDNKGHPHVKMVGVTAGDEESYEVFNELFEAVTSARHNGYPKNAIQPTNMDISKISDTDIDPENKYVLTTRVRTGRSIRGFRLPPMIEFEERRRMEALVVKALESMGGNLKGEYFPLHGSRSHSAKPNGMSEEKEDELRKIGNLFQEPDSPLLLAAGMARHWPDARGVYHNNDRNLFVWVGEEDHLRIVSMQGLREKPTKEGKNIKETCARFIRTCDEVQKVLQGEGLDFMHSPHFGWILTCPSNLGTGLRAGSMLMIPKVSSRKDFKTLLDKMDLQARGIGGVDSDSVGGVYDISNAGRIGKGEVDFVNIFIEGVAQIVKWESALDKGQHAQVDKEIRAVLAK